MEWGPPVRVSLVKIAATRGDAEVDGVKVPSHHHCMDWHVVVRCGGSNPDRIRAGSGKEGDEVGAIRGDGDMEGESREAGST